MIFLQKSKCETIGSGGGDGGGGDPQKLANFIFCINRRFRHQKFFKEYPKFTNSRNLEKKTGDLWT